MSWYTSGKLWAFVGGVAATCVTGALGKCPAVRQAVVKGAAQGMLIKEQAECAVQSIKDDAEDICADACIRAKLAAARAEREALIEERVRKQVEEEIAKEDLNTSMAADTAAAES